MKKRLLSTYLIFILPLVLVMGQGMDNDLQGVITYKSSKNVYVKFLSTSTIEVGDTLSLQYNTQPIKALVVKQKSTTSCVTENITDIATEIGQSVNFRFSKPSEVISENKADTKPEVIVPAVTIDSDQDTVVQSPLKNRKQVTTGRLTFSTNASINPDNNNNFQRIRAAISLNIQNIHKSAFSVQSYLTYRHRYGIEQQRATYFYDDFKIFTLSVQYAPTDKYTIWVGRKMNNNIANMGAIDGVQAEYVLGRYIGGAFAGTRPDFTNFTFNKNLPQFGAYLVRNDKTAKGISQTSIAIAEQMNQSNTDRRFVYFQHNNSLVKNLNLFFSSEMDLYKKVNGETSHQPQLTSIYASLRYRIRNNLSLSGSYDNRRNIIYYESYQTFIDQLLAQETRQGFRLQANYSPFKKININTSAFYRYQGSNAKPTSNYIANINFNSILKKSTTASVNINLLESFYFKGMILGGRISDNFFKGKLNTEVNYRNINYTFFNTETGLKQHIAGISFSINLLKKTALMCSYEGTFEPSKAWHRYFITITQRIKN
ncbi:MAG: outer membrane beta-barrel family protein [Chitinophagales bacterium]|nr:outer membrane beta-barrel family protein [Chitinophagales bacterium]